MKINSRILTAVFIALLIPAFVFGAEIMEDDPETVTPVPKKASTPAPVATAKPVSVATAKPVPTAVPTAVKPEVSAAEVAELKMKLEDLNRSVSALNDEIKLLEEKTIQSENAAKDLELYKKQLETIRQNRDEDAKKTAELEKALNDMQGAVKVKIDKMSSWDDILAVLKKEISNNELEIARLKKEINSLKKMYGGGSDNVFDAIAEWPYTGFVALIISIAAFITVFTKQ